VKRLAYDTDRDATLSDVVKAPARRRAFIGLDMLTAWINEWPTFVMEPPLQARGPFPRGHFVLHRSV
jgi:hypothetical protein